MQPISYILWLIVTPLILGFLGGRLLKRGTLLVVIIELIVILPLTYIRIIENYHVGNIQRQLSSYFGKITNDFYLKYLPSIILTIIFVQIFKKLKRRS